MWARQYTVTPSQILEWWPDAELRKGDLRETQWRYQKLADGWLSGARLSYNLGILSLLAGVLVILIPREWTPSRIAAAAVIGAGVLIEVYWVLGPVLGVLPLAKRVFRTPKDLPETAPPCLTTGQ
jgi:hypothetical protein